MSTILSAQGLIVNVAWVLTLPTFVQHEADGTWDLFSVSVNRWWSTKLVISRTFATLASPFDCIHIPMGGL